LTIAEDDPFDSRLLVVGAKLQLTLPMHVADREKVKVAVPVFL